MHGLTQRVEISCSQVPPASHLEPVFRGQPQGRLPDSNFGAHANFGLLPWRALTRQVALGERDFQRGQTAHLVARLSVACIKKRGHAGVSIRAMQALQDTSKRDKACGLRR